MMSLFQSVSRRGFPVRSFATRTSSFPSLIIRPNELLAKGSFAEAQAEFLCPDEDTVEQLDTLLHNNNVGVVAHFYMDPELQGVLQAVSWPHVFIADSLAMGDAAVKMAKSGVKAITVLGVDFMSENVQATLRAEGYDTPVYRLSEQHIGCSLAESAEGTAYAAYLEQASKVPNSLHVVYINTSLHTKANAQNRIPTITCTSSNVVNTILQAAAQVPNVNIFFGPDTCMGENLVQTFEHLASLSDAEIAAIHSGHTKATIQSLLTRFNYYKQGICVVHHMFDESVTSRLQRDHMDAHLTAHFEVPGVMFDLSLEAQAQNRGKVGSTSDILNYIVDEVQATAATHPTKPVTLPFVLGTEAGMITGIVAKVQHVLQELDSKHVEAEIIFPVADSAISVVSADPTNTGADLGIVPGVTAGEGCSAGGGCATCPYMKMNNLDSLLRVVELAAYEAPTLELAPYLIQNKGSVRETQTGVIPINHMRMFQREGAFPTDLVTDITTRNQPTSQ